MNAIEKIHELNRFGSRLGLERMTVLLDKLGNPHKDMAVIHVAGTNGKGSVCKYLEEGLAACGYKVGLYTSPFIEKFNERIRLDGADISDDDLAARTERALAAVDEMVAEGLDSPTEFEVVTAIAFLYFKERSADITILEVGLGGSGDSTNVVEKPLACAITSIAYDHMDRLGNTLEEIAGEKAGIIKEGVPVISNVEQREAAAVIARKAYEKGSKLYDVAKIGFAISDGPPCVEHFGSQDRKETQEWTGAEVDHCNHSDVGLAPLQTISMELWGTDYSDVEISMLGVHQGENLKTALAIIEVLRKERKIKVERGKLYAGLKKAVQPGRFEVLQRPEDGDAAREACRQPVVIIDGAHNEAGARALRETMEQYFAGRRVLLVTGMLADKQVDAILEHFANITKDMIITEPDNPRRLPVDQLEGFLKKMGIAPVKAADAAESIKLARERWEEYDAVLFAGSLYLIGNIRRILRHERGSEGNESTGCGAEAK